MPRVNGRNPATGLSKSTNKEKYSIIIIIIIIIITTIITIITNDEELNN